MRKCGVSLTSNSFQQLLCFACCDKHQVFPFSATVLTSQTIGFLHIVKMQSFPEAGRFLGFLLGLSENTILFLLLHHTILQNSINNNKENGIFEDSMQAVIIPPRFKDNYQILGLPKSGGNISSLWMSLHPGHMSGIFNVTFIKSYILPFKAESLTTDGIKLHSGQGSFQVGQVLCKPCSTLAQFMESIKSSLPPFLGMLIFSGKNKYFIVSAFFALVQDWPEED